jgi:hypothetical protein
VTSTLEAISCAHGLAPYEVTTEVLRYPGITGWHYVTLPTEIVEDIRGRFGNSARAFGSLAVSVELGHSTWSTSLFYDNNTDVVPAARSSRHPQAGARRRGRHRDGPARRQD